MVTTRSVVPVRVDPHTVESLWWIDPARVDLPRFQDIPLLEEINEELPYVGRLRMAPDYSLPVPHTPKTLYQNLLLLLALSPPVSLSGLVRYHAYFDKLHSTTTFNYLIEMSIRNASFGTARYLFRMMDAQRIPGNLETRKLRVRMLVRTGDWVVAWKQETQEDPEVQFMPVAIWLEFLQIPRREEEFKVTKSKRGGGHGLGLAKRTAIREHSNSLSREEKLLLALKHPPNPNPKEYAEMQPRVVREVVQALLTINREKAFDLTRRYFNSLPSQITPRRRRQCMDIIHAHMTARSKGGVSEFARIRDLLPKLLNMHSSFIPNSTTLFLLLAPLKQTNQCGTIAEATVKKFRRRWGEDIVDLRVKRRVASFASKEGRRDLLEGTTGSTIQGAYATEIRVDLLKERARGVEVEVVTETGL
ncbi:hypothetical protein NLI96_g965 [Meripilus lineatus]|uniref:Uncharacterized protein n=1 Tax=Meripilus lineatus TaxID=2056292 RepID=A0AAD5VGV7_9APHY|nr:hypothetical protein NLI96_g965 [Physisporinus lineatus]